MASSYNHPDEAFGTKLSPGDPNPLTLKPESDAAVPGSEPSKLHDIDVERLRESMEWSARQLAPFRQLHTEAVKYYAGSRYAGTGVARMPVNMMRLAVDIWVRQLVSQDPRCLVLTNASELKIDAYELEIAVNHVFRQIQLGDTLARVVRDAMFTLGIMKIGVTEQYLAASSGMPSAGGQVFAEPVLFEDWLHDANARSLEECDWYGNRYRVPLQSVLGNEEYSKEARSRLERTRSRNMGDGLGESQSRESEITGASDFNRTEFREHIELWDIYIPSDRVVVTLAAQAGTPALAVKPWVGPEQGPFRLLFLSRVPGNLLPAAPAQHIYELQDLLTRLFNQLGRQASRQKTLTIVDGQADADGTAERVMDGDDGAVIRTSHIDGVREMKYGGIDPGNFQFVDYIKQLFSYLGGNLDAMGGLAQQANTLGQEQLLVQTSSEMIRDMQAKVLKFTKDVMTDLGWWLYTDQLGSYDLAKNIEGYGEIPFQYGPDNRRAEFYNFNLDLSPYSLQSKGPQERLSAIMQISQNLLLPLAPQMGEWGLQLNLKKLIELVGKYSDLPEIADLISSDQKLMGSGIVQNPHGRGGGSERPLQSPNTTRNYVRSNVSTGPTNNARSHQAVQNLMKATQE